MCVYVCGVLKTNMIGRVVATLGAATTVQNPSILFSSENRFRLCAWGGGKAAMTGV